MRRGHIEDTSRVEHVPRVLIYPLHETVDRADVKEELDNVNDKQQRNADDDCYYKGYDNGVNDQFIPFPPHVRRHLFCFKEYER